MYVHHPMGYCSTGNTSKHAKIVVIQSFITINRERMYAINVEVVLCR